MDGYWRTITDRRIVAQAPTGRTFVAMQCTSWCSSRVPGSGSWIFGRISGWNFWNGEARHKLAALLSAQVWDLWSLLVTITTVSSVRTAQSAAISRTQCEPKWSIRWWTFNLYLCQKLLCAKNCYAFHCCFSNYCFYACAKTESLRLWVVCLCLYVCLSVCVSRKLLTNILTIAGHSLSDFQHSFLSGTRMSVSNVGVKGHSGVKYFETPLFGFGNISWILVHTIKIAKFGDAAPHYDYINESVQFRIGFRLCITATKQNCCRCDFGCTELRQCLEFCTICWIYVFCWF